MKLKLAVLCSLLSTFIFSSAIQASSNIDIGEFGISNQTDYSLSFAINRLCSSELGNVTGYSIKTIPLNNVIKLCAETNLCEITSYDSPDCRGIIIGRASIDFMNHKIEILPNPIHKVNLSGKVGLYQYNLFFYENNLPHLNS